MAQLSDGRRWFVELRHRRPVVLPALGEHTGAAHVAARPRSRRATNRLLSPTGRGWFGSSNSAAACGGRSSRTATTASPANRHRYGRGATCCWSRCAATTASRSSAWTRTSGKPRGPAARRSPTPTASTSQRPTRTPSARTSPPRTSCSRSACATARLAWEVGTAGHARRSRVGGARGKSCVIAYPAEAIPAEPPDAVFDRLARSFRARTVRVAAPRTCRDAV